MPSSVGILCHRYKGGMVLKYPMTANWLIYRRISREEYQVTDSLRNTDYTMTAQAVKFAKNLDGKHSPYDIAPDFSAEEIDCLLDELEASKLLRKGRWIHPSPLTFLFTLWIPKRKTSGRVMSVILHRLISLLWFPTLVFGIRSLFYNIYLIDLSTSPLHLVMGLAIALVCHELAHAWAGITYGAHIHEFGIGLSNLLICAYTLLTADHCTKAHRRRIFAAGIECNFFLAGLSLLLIPLMPNSSALLYNTGFCNALAGIYNSLCILGIDGMSLLSLSLGEDSTNLICSVIDYVHSKKLRRKLRRKDVHSRAKLLLCYLIYAMQFLFIIVIVASVWEIVLWFI